MTIKNKSISKELNFASDNDSRSFTIPYIITPKIKLIKNIKDISLNDEEVSNLRDHFNNIKSSHLNKGGVALICGTYDNLHIGHKVMLATAAKVCDKLYIGAEDQGTALHRKNHKHPILANKDRINAIKDFNITNPEYVFIRKNATEDIIRLKNEGIKLNTFIVGESQKDNPEIVSAVDYCMKHNIQVIAITRLRALDNKSEISSSSFHRKI